MLVFDGGSEDVSQEVGIEPIDLKRVGGVSNKFIDLNP